MKRIFIVLLCLILTVNSSFAFGFHKKKQNKEQMQEPKSGYNGSLPDIEQAFDGLRVKPKVPNSIYDYNTNLDKEMLEKIPLDNSKYVEIIMKKNEPSRFVLDVLDLIAILEKIKHTIDTNTDFQFYNAQVATLINQVNYFQDKYYGKSEFNVEDYQKLLAVCNKARDIAVSYSQRQLTEKYIPTSNNPYKQDYINLQMKELSMDISDIIDLLKNFEAK